MEESMKILACDTSSSVCAVGVFENDKLKDFDQKVAEPYKKIK